MGSFAVGVGGSQFPPGFRFHPTDQELIIHYLRSKVTSSLNPFTCIIADVDIYKFNPWDLPDKACFGEGEWFFFSPRDRKYPNGSRPNRAAGSGYWKATGTDKPILANSGTQCLGVKKALVFYKGRPPKGIKTDWVMHEYRLLKEASSHCLLPRHRGSMRLDDYVLCRVRHKGSIPAQQTEERSEISDISNRFANQKTEDSSSSHRSDYKLLEKLLNSQEEGSDSGSENSDMEYSKSSGLNSTMAINGCGANQAQPSDVVSSVLNSIKKTLSLGVMDEFMLLPQNKRPQYWNSDCDRLSRSSVQQTCPKFFI